MDARRLKRGDRIVLEHMHDDPHPIEVGQRGTVDEVCVHDDLGHVQVWVDWDNGRTLALVCPPDKFKMEE